MTWTYSGNPASTARDEVRFLSGDTDTTDQQVTDEEIAWALSENSSNAYTAASVIAYAISAKFARKADKSVGDLSLSYSQLSKQYAELGARLRSQGAFRGITPYSGGISTSDKDTQNADTDYDKPSFTRKLMDAPGRGDGDDGINQ